MKRIATIAMIVTIGFAFDLGNVISDGKNIIGDLVGDFTDTAADVASQCYEPTYKDQIKNMCDYLDFSASYSIDYCKGLPDLPGFRKKSSTLSYSYDTAALKEYCNGKVDKANSVISDADIYTGDNTKDGTYPNGKTRDTYYQDVANVDDIVKKDSLASTVFKSNDQETMRYLVEVGKAMDIDSITDIKIDDLKAPKDMNDYIKQRDALAASVTNDIEMVAPTNVAASVKSKIQGKQGAAAAQAAALEVGKLQEMIEAGKSKRIGLMLDLYRKKDDLALPTEEMLKYIRKDLRPKYIAKIRMQQKRDAAIVSYINQIDDYRKTLVELTAKKEVILNEKFDEAAAQARIDDLIK